VNGALPSSSFRAPLCTLTLEHGGQLPHTQAPDGRVLAQGTLQQEERDPREDECQEVWDQEGPWEGRGQDRWSLPPGFRGTCPECLWGPTWDFLISFLKGSDQSQTEAQGYPLLQVYPLLFAE
jgi:hypothetical protein